MNLETLLDTLRRLYLNDRSDRISGSSDYLWEDKDLVMYINEAQLKFAIETYCLHDATTPEVVNVTIRSGVDTYNLHPAIIDVVTARISTSTVDMTRVGHSALSSYTNPADRVMYSSQFEHLNPGPPLAFATDETLVEDDEGTISALQMRIYPVPRDEDDGTLLKLRVVRKPLDDLVASSLSAIPEIPRENHLELLAWAAHLALSIEDQDAGNSASADKWAAKFETYVENARKLVLRKLFAPQPWGFGRNGWNWGGPRDV